MKIGFPEIAVGLIGSVLLIKAEFRMIRTMLTKPRFDWTQILRFTWITARLGIVSNAGLQLVVIAVFYYALLVVVALCGKTE